MGMQCLIELYKCQEIGQTNCPQAKGCVLIDPVVTEESETEDYVEGSGVLGLYLPPGDGSVGLGSNSQIGSAHGSVSSSAETPSGLVTSTTNNPVHGGVGGNNPECVWAYFGCKDSQRNCKRRFKQCSNGKSPDDEICAQVAEQPQNYLVPHPADCKKFYSCQNLGWRGGWIAHLMDCPATTGFDTKLRICNYIKALPRCSKEKARTLYKEIDGVINAKQTRQIRNHASISGPSRSISLEVPKAGFLKTNPGLNANLENSSYSRNQISNSHEAYSIPITNIYNSARPKAFGYVSLWMLPITVIVLLLK